MSLPRGFDGIYRCKQHPEREATAPIALRLCDECHQRAREDYAEVMLRQDQDARLHGDQHEGTTPWGEDIRMGRTRIRERKQEI